MPAVQAFESSSSGKDAPTCSAIRQHLLASVLQIGLLRAHCQQLFVLLPCMRAGANPRLGALTLDGVQHNVVLQDLPTVIESYKTLDDANLVKVADIGQVSSVAAALHCLVHSAHVQNMLVDYSGGAVCLQELCVCRGSCCCSLRASYMHHM